MSEYSALRVRTGVLSIANVKYNEGDLVTAWLVLSELKSVGYPNPVGRTIRSLLNEHGFAFADARRYAEGAAGWSGKVV